MRLQTCLIGLLWLQSIVLARDLNLVHLTDTQEAERHNAPKAAHLVKTVQETTAKRQRRLRQLQGMATDGSGNQATAAVRMTTGHSAFSSAAAAATATAVTPSPKLTEQKKKVYIPPKGSEAGTFDFIIAGFPKCGTTTLLKALGSHPDTAMSEKEQCSIASPLQADKRVHALLDQTLQALDDSKKRAFKCPTTMYNYKSLARMVHHSPAAKMIVGMRHPIRMLQSFYNYRIAEIGEKGLDEEVPPLRHLLADDAEPWKGVSMESTRFELFLQQMGKAHMSPEQFTEMAHQKYDLAVKPTDFTVFLYTVDQLEDTDAARSLNLRTVMQDYLGLTQPIQAFGHENKNHHATTEAGPSSSVKQIRSLKGGGVVVNICDDEWADVRLKLVEQGRVTAAWIRDEFMLSPDVVVANPEHFVETMETWGTDPCVDPSTHS